MKYRAEIIVDVGSRYMYREVEADSPEEAQDKAQLACKQEIEEFLEMRIQDHYWDIETSAVGEAHSKENQYTWDFWGEQIERLYQ